MTKFDIRLRRKQFTQGRIERHKNFQNLMKNYDRSSKRKTRGVMVLVIVLILIITILLAFFNTSQQPKKASPKDQVSHNVVNLQGENIKINMVYKL